MGRKIVVTSGKGGVGKTTLTASLGIAIAETGKKVVLVDADIGLNNLDVVLAVENKVVYDVLDVISGKCRLKQALIQDVDNPTLYVLPSAKIQDSPLITACSFRNVVDALALNFDFVIIDCPAGIDNGQTISLRGQGNAGRNGGPAGDLLIVIAERPHEIFRREGTSVLCEAPITFTQAVLGAELEIPTIDGKVKYSIPEGTQSGTTFRLKGKGIPGLNGRARGDQYVTVYIETPRNLNREQKEALRKFSDTLGESNYEQRKSFFGKFKL